MQTNVTIHDMRIKLLDHTSYATFVWKSSRLQTAGPPLIVKNGRNFQRVKQMMYNAPYCDSFIPSSIFFPSNFLDFFTKLEAFLGLLICNYIKRIMCHEPGERG